MSFQQLVDLIKPKQIPSRITSVKEVLTASLFVCLLAGLHKYYWFHLHEENEEMGQTQIPLNSENDPDHYLDTKNIKDPDFSIYLLLTLFKTRVQWLAFCQPRSRILGQQWVMKSVNCSIIARICKLLAKTFTDLCSEMCWVFVVTGKETGKVYKWRGPLCQCAV